MRWIIITSLAFLCSCSNRLIVSDWEPVDSRQETASHKEKLSSAEPVCEVSVKEKGASWALGQRCRVENTLAVFDSLKTYNGMVRYGYDDRERGYILLGGTLGLAMGLVGLATAENDGLMIGLSATMIGLGVISLGLGAYSELVGPDPKEWYSIYATLEKERQFKRLFTVNQGDVRIRREAYYKYYSDPKNPAPPEFIPNVSSMFKDYTEVLAPIQVKKSEITEHEVYENTAAMADATLDVIVAGENKSVRANGQGILSWEQIRPLNLQVLDWINEAGTIQVPLSFSWEGKPIYKGVYSLKLTTAEYESLLESQYDAMKSKNAMKMKRCEKKAGDSAAQMLGCFYGGNQ